MTIAVPSFEDASELQQRLAQDPSAHASLAALLWNTTGQTPLHLRFRALFSLKNLNTLQAVEIIGRGFTDTSSLLKHELAYVLGQMGRVEAVPILVRVLRDEREEPMVRHEAAEALGAIGAQESMEVLTYYSQAAHEPEEVVRQTCELALAKMKHEQQIQRQSPGEQQQQQQEDVFRRNENSFSSAYTSTDPAPPLDPSSHTLAALEAMLLNDKLPLFDRYRAMFTLRNKGGPEAVQSLAKGFKDPSALFRHEIAYVFGQMQDEHSVKPLLEVLANENEEAMVRHECAEALGSIATEECLPVLERFRQDEERVVRESCAVALDMVDYASHEDQFHYGLTETSAQLPGH